MHLLEWIRYVHFVQNKIIYGHFVSMVFKDFKKCHKQKSSHLYLLILIVAIIFIFFPAGWRPCAVWEKGTFKYSSCQTLCKHGWRIYRHNAKIWQTLMKGQTDLYYIWYNCWCCLPFLSNGNSSQRDATCGVTLRSTGNGLQNNTQKLTTTMTSPPFQVSLYF